MTSFKEFLAERIYRANDNVVISMQHDREASTKEAISTFIRRNPYQTHIVGAGDSIIYSILNYVPSEESTKLLQTIKGKGPYQVKSIQLDAFIKQLVNYCASVLQKLRPDLIVSPKSSSPFISNFIEQLKLAYPKAEYLTDAFVKTANKADDIEPLLNKEHPAWKKFAEEHPKNVDMLRKSLAHQIETYGTLELKKLYKPHLKFVKNFIQLKDVYEMLDKIAGKRVIAVDDVLSSGATMVEMLRQLHELEPKFIAGLTIFKRTTGIKE